MTLAELTEAEERLLSEVERVTGSMEEKHMQLVQRGVFNNYARVHVAYAELAFGGDTEALKRALFLQWYAVSEPACFSGLFELELEAERRVLELLDGSVSGDDFDAELEWMLPHYHTINDYYFDSCEGLPALKRWLRKHASDEFPVDRVRDAALDGRGQMSRYWYRPNYTSL